MKVFNLPFGITVIIADDGETSRIESPLSASADDPCLEAAYDAVESFILSLAVQGYDLSDPRFTDALECTVEAIENKIG